MYQLTIIIPSNEEVESLQDTVQFFVDSLNIDYQIKVLLKSADCPSAAVVRKMKKLHPDWALSYKIQKSKKQMDVFEEFFSLSGGTHLLIWSSDNETDAKSIIPLIEVSEKKPNAIVSLSKFHKDSVVVGYGVIKTFVRKLLNWLVCVLYKRQGSDFFTPLELMPVRYLDEYRYSKNRNLIFEYNLIPLKMGVEYMELPMVYHNRTEGKPNYNLLFNMRFAFLYLYNIVRICFIPKRKLLNNYH